MQMRWFVGLVAPVAAGCGLGLAGLGGPTAGDDAGTADQGPTLDAQVPRDAGSAPGEAGDGDAGDTDTSEAADSAPPCIDAVPPDWSLTLFSPTRATCPAGTAAVDAVAGGDAGDGACACSCEVSGPVSCETGTLQVTNGATAVACGASTTPVAVSSELCSRLPEVTPMPAYMAVRPLPPTGSCLSMGTADPTRVTPSAVRLCEVGDAGAQDVCVGQVPAGFQACIAHGGSESCPAGTSFLQRRVISEGVALSCSACSACSITGSCTDPTVAFFADGVCGSGVIALAADGTCAPTEVQNTEVGSVLYNATPADGGTGCAPGSSSATLTPSGPLTTLCCR